MPTLRVVGTGIRAIGQTSPEALACIVDAQQVFYVHGDALARAWLTKLNPSAQSLQRFYRIGRKRIETYHAIADHVLDVLRSGRSVCMVTSGHPGAFSRAAHRMIRLARAEGYDAQMLPGISAEDCLFADLGVDPGGGLLSFEATDFLTTAPPFNATSALVLWQIGTIGDDGWRHGNEAWNREGLALLGRVLGDVYGCDHAMTVYEAARYVFVRPVIEPVTPATLASARVTLLSTLYVPPARERSVDPGRVALLVQQTLNATPA